MPLDPVQIGKDMIAAAAKKAGAEWQNIRSVAELQIRSLAQSLVDIVENTVNGSLDTLTAKQLTQMARNTAIATIAMITQLVISAVQKIVNAALAVVKTAINSAIGFTLI